MKTLLQIALLLVITLLSAAYFGYAIAVLWGWFVVPTFGLTPLSIPVAYGISILARMCIFDATITRVGQDDKIPEVIIKSITFGIMIPSFALGFGYVATLFI